MENILFLGVGKRFSPDILGPRLHWAAATDTARLQKKSEELEASARWREVRLNKQLAQCQESRQNEKRLGEDMLRARPAPSPSPDFVPGLPHIMLIELR